MKTCDGSDCLLVLAKLDVLEAQLPAKVRQLSARALFGVLQDAATAGGAANVIDGVLTRRLFQVLVKRAQETGVALDDLGQMIVQIGVRDLRRRQIDRDLLSGDSQIRRFQLRQ